ncbi:MAG: sulfite exporter TauE/SafE family protein [Pseudomonadales bacterium]|nr:sulfite exporter TauE/SafE family protein [Pseudomonadales bacterium]
MMLLMLAVIGFTAGALSGVFGIGGGTLIVPALVYGLGYSQKLATGTSLAILLPPVGIMAVMEYYKAGHVDLRASLIIALSLVLGSWLSARWAIGVNGHTLKAAFGVFLILLGAYIIYDVTMRQQA